MKQLKVVFAVFLFAAALAVCTLFACTLLIGNFTGTENDLATGLGTVIALLLTIIPVIAGLPVALALIVIGIFLLILKKQWGCAVAALVFLSVFLPAFWFAVIIDYSVFVSVSLPLVLILGVCALLYVTAFALSIAYVAALHKARKVAK